MASITTKIPTASQSDVMDTTDSRRLKTVGGLIVAGLIAMLIANSVLNNIHAKRVDPAYVDAQALVGKVSYAQAANMMESSDEGVDTSNFVPLILPSLLPDQRSSSFQVVTKTNDTVLMGFTIKTFARESCVILAVSPTDSTVGLTDSSCLGPKLPANVQKVVDS